MAAAQQKFRVVVIGGGLAGLAATFEAAQSSQTHVTLIDKEPRTGGNSAKATSGINGVGKQELISVSCWTGISPHHFTVCVRCRHCRPGQPKSGGQRW